MSAVWNSARPTSGGWTRSTARRITPCSSKNDKPYKLDQMLVWNSNQLIESFIGLGTKDMVVETSLDGTDWTVMEGATQFNQATGAEGYEANTSIDFGGVLAQYVKITINSGYGMPPP